MDILVTGLQGLAAFASTPVGAGVLLLAIITMVIKLIQWSPTKADDKWLAKFGPIVYSAASMAEKAIPDKTQITALAFLDAALKAIGESGQVDVSDKKIMTVVKDQLIKIAKASAKIDTSEAKLAELKN